ncbi:exosporium leader peptide, partial [Bacillus anthracis]
AKGDFSHVEGVETQAIGNISHVEGKGNCSKFEGAHIMGKYGDAQEPFSWFIGNGLASDNREIGAKWLASTRNMYIDGTTYISGGTNYAEMFEVM